ncbi:MAG TPA: EAL domain-containing protein [Burkholderiaceae bacterium]|nr:EAL domain-containing protein [Burkholderiaceae bacterium]
METNDANGFARYGWLTAGLSLLFCATFALYVWSEKQIDRVNDARHASLLLADELRQSSDDLSRMARSYVATGDPAFRQHYDTILAIRDGRSPRPLDYHIVYWDLVPADGQPPRADGPAVPLLVLMRQAGMTAGELALLQQAKAHSDRLTGIERAAMALAGPGADPAARALATSMLNDASYRQGKAAIMRPIMQFQTQLERRTEASVLDAETRALWARLAFLLAGALLVALLLQMLRVLRHTLGAPVTALHASIARLGGGDFATPIAVPPGREESVQGWLAATRVKLAASDAHRADAERKSWRLQRFYAVLSHCNQIIVRSASIEELYQNVCLNLVARGGMRMAWVGLLAPDGHAIRPAASSGTGTSYLDGLALTASADQASGRGPTGTAVREDRPYWCQDFRHDPATAPWHERAAQYGWAGTAALPLHRAGKVCGALTLYVDEVDAFDAEVQALLLDMAADIDYAVANLDRLARHAKAEHQVRYLAHFDPLTGLANRSYMNELAQQAFAAAGQSGSPVALLFLDLDNFKDINDALGHSVGDAVLAELAHRLRVKLGLHDLACRLGGDEFILLLYGAGRAEAATRAQRLLAAVAAPCRIEQYDLHLSASIGIAVYPEDGAGLELLLQRADMAMYRAKHEGRNGFRLFAPPMQEHFTRQLQLVGALRQALGSDQLQVVYQPQVALRNGAVVGAEALLRWQHPALGAVSPAEFIPAAEHSGLILPLGEWVLRQAARQARAWMAAGLPALTMAVNLSAVQFRHPDLPELVSRILREEDLAPQYLELELTEGIAMHDPHGAVLTMNSLHERGVRMSIDDFGTGFSSLSYLKQFKIYKLKIDRSFVRDIDSNPEDQAIVAAIVNMARGLGLCTISEGVETVQQLDLLREQGCDEIQGFYYSRPLAPDQFAAFVRARTGMA